MTDTNITSNTEDPWPLSVDIGHRWLVERKPCDPEWVERCLSMMKRRPLRPLLKGIPVESRTAQVAAALTLLPLEHWDVSMVQLIRLVDIPDISPPRLHSPLLGDEAMANGWKDWSALVCSGALSRSRLLHLWCLEFVRQLQPPGLHAEVSSIVNGWLQDERPHVPTSIELFAIRIAKECRGVSVLAEACLDTDKDIFLAISAKVNPREWSPATLLAIVPGALLETSFPQGLLPRRVLNRMRDLGATTWRDLLSYDKQALPGLPSFGETSFLTIRNAIVPAVQGMVSEREMSGAPVLDRIRDWLHNSQNSDGRNIQIFELRLGINEKDGDSPTLDDLGTRFGVTRERIRQVVRKTWDTLAATLPILALIGETLSRRIKVHHGLLPVEDLRHDPLICSLVATKATFQVMIGLGWVPGARIWKAGVRDRLFLSLLDDERTIALLRALKDEIATGDEDIDLVSWCSTYEISRGIDREMAMAHILAAFDLPDGQKSIKARKGNRIRSDILDMLEASPVPMHFREVARRITDDEWDPEGARVQGMIASIPGVMLLSMGCYGTKRHFPEMDAVTPDVIQATLEIMTSGSYDLERDWAMHALVPMVDELADPPCGLDAYRLHAILCSSPDLFIDTGRLTVRLNLAHGGPDAGQGEAMRPAARRQRHLLAVEVLESAGGPMDASALEERVRQQRDIKDIHELVVHYSEMLVILHDDRIGLVPRDLPGDPGARACVADAMVDILMSRGWSIGLESAVETPPLPKFIPGLSPEGLRAILLQDDRFLKRPSGLRAALSAWNEERANPPAESLLELAEGLGEGFTTRQMLASVQDVFGETPGAQAVVKILRGTLRWMQTPGGQWIRTPRTSP